MNSSSFIVDLDEMINHLQENNAFDFTATSPAYNPIEFFINKLHRKEEAHNQILADLLNPLGLHGNGTIFLKEFICRTLGSDTIRLLDINLDNTQVFTEYPISTVLDNSDGERVYGRIDILLKFKNIKNEDKLAIIIENKLNYASYGYQQLEKYKKAIIEEGFSDNTYIVCLHPIGYEKHALADYIFSPKTIANMLEETINNLSSDELSVLNSYILYLKNLNMENKSLENAISLLPNLSKEKVERMKAIKCAYDQLPQAYAHHFKTIVGESGDSYLNSKEIKVEINECYPNYVDLWRIEDDNGNDMSWRWLSVGFYYDSVWFYLVANRRSHEEIRRYAQLGDFTETSSSGGWTWHKSNTLPHSMNFSEKHDDKGMLDFDRIMNDAICFLKEIDNADNKFNSPK